MRRRRVMGLFLVLALFLSGCWDKLEMDDLALVSMIGVDSDPESGQKVVYYQIINPLSGTSARSSSQQNEAPVYTYKVRGESYGEIRSVAYKLLPRHLFIAHNQILLISHQVAQEGVRDLANFVEMLPNSRATIPMLVVEGSVYKAMESLTPLEEVPSDSIHSRVKLLARESLFVGKKIRICDLIERMERDGMIVLPIVKAPEQSAGSSAGTSENVNAAENNLLVEGGAVFDQYRMVGTLSNEELVWYYLLNGSRGRQMRHFEEDGEAITVEFRLVHMHREVAMQGEKPEARITLELELSTAWASAAVPTTQTEVQQFQDRINQRIEEELQSFYQMSMEKGWDLIGIKDLLRKKMPRHADADLSEVRVTFEVHTRLMQMGGLKEPYEQGRSG